MMLNVLSQFCFESCNSMTHALFEEVGPPIHVPAGSQMTAQDPILGRHVTQRHTQTHTLTQRQTEADTRIHNHTHTDAQTHRATETQTLERYVSQTQFLIDVFVGRGVRASCGHR